MSSLGKIEHVNNLYDDIGAQYLNKELSDVTFIVESKYFYCHKITLASRSEYFKTLLYGNFNESLLSEIKINGITSSAFELLINYIYTSKMDLTCLEIEEVFDVHQMVHQFSFGNIETEVVNYLKEMVNISNVCVISERALLFQIEALETVCSKCIDDNASDIIESWSFTEFSMPLLKKTLSRDTFVDEEVVIFRAVANWIEHNRPTSGELSDVLELVRLPLISSKDLVNVVWPSKLFPDSVILEAIKTRSNQKKCVEINYRLYRGYSSLEENLTIVSHGSEIKVSNQTLKDRSCAMSWNLVENGKPDGTNKAIIRLGKLCLVNCLKIHLIENCYGYSPYSNSSKLEQSFLVLEASSDEKDWSSIINFQKHSSKFWCMIRFPPTVAKYFRITFYDKSSEICPQLDFVHCTNDLPQTN